MLRGNREKREYLSRRSLLLAIGEAAVTAPVLDPDPNFQNADPMYRFYQDERSTGAPCNRIRQSRRNPEDDQIPGLPALEELVPEEGRSDSREGNQEDELGLSRYDHAA